MPNVFEINAAIEDVISSHGNDRAAAAMVIQFAQTLPETTKMMEKRTSWGKKNGGILRGFTKEAGNVTLKDEADREEKKEWLGESKARVGHYRLWRAFDQIFFHHYWASDAATSDISEEPPETFVLKYHSTTLEMEWLGKLAYDAEWQQAGLFTRRKEIFLLLLDREHEGQRRPFGEHKSRIIRIQLTVEDVERFKQYIKTPEGKLVLAALCLLGGLILGGFLISIVMLVTWATGHGR